MKAGTKKKGNNWMQHGETGSQLPRQISNQMGRQACNVHNTEKRYRGGNLFFVPDPDAMKRVVVETRQPKRVFKKPDKKN